MTKQSSLQGGYSTLRMKKAAVFSIAVITDEISQDLAVAAALVKEFDGSALEIRSVWEKNPHEFDADDIRRIKRIADDYGLRICDIASPFYKCTLGNAEEEKQHLDILRRCIAVAHARRKNRGGQVRHWRGGLPRAVQGAQGRWVQGVCLPGNALARPPRDSRSSIAPPER